MNKTMKNIVIRTLAVTALVGGAFGTANAGIFVRRVIVAPVRVVAPVAVVAPVRVVAPVAIVAPVAVVAPAPAVAAPVMVAPAPVVAAPVVVAAAPVAVYVPTCRFVSVPVVNAFTGVTYLATRRVCN
jgi:hypothetical protein